MIWWGGEVLQLSQISDLEPMNTYCTVQYSTLPQHTCTCLSQRSFSNIDDLFADGDGDGDVLPSAM